MFINIVLLLVQIVFVCVCVHHHSLIAYELCMYPIAQHQDTNTRQGSEEMLGKIDGRQETFEPERERERKEKISKELEERKVIISQ